MSTGESPAVSVVIPTYNHASLLKLALESVRAQTEPGWEAIVINNYSDDDTVDIVNDFKDPRIKLVNFHNHGCIAASRNQGIKHAKADLVAFLDSDDIWLPEKLERCLAAFEPGTGLLCHGLRFERNGEFWKNVVYGRGFENPYRHLLYVGDTFPPTAILVKKDFLERVGGFSEDVDLITGEDYELLLKLAKEGAKFKFINDILGVYRRHGGNASKSVFRQMDAVFVAVNKHFPARKNATFGERLLMRRRTALIYVGFARAFQMEGDRKQALRHFVKAAKAFPILPKLWAAIVLFLISYVRSE